MYRPLEFYEFNTSNWEGFPTEDDPDGSADVLGRRHRLVVQAQARRRLSDLIP